MSSGTKLKGRYRKFPHENWLCPCRMAYVGWGIWKPDTFLMKTTEHNIYFFPNCISKDSDSFCLQYPLNNEDGIVAMEISCESFIEILAR